MEKRISLRAKLGPAVLLFLFVSAIYLYAFPQANLVYPAVVLAHAGLGLLATVGILWQVFRNIKSRDWLIGNVMVCSRNWRGHRRGTDLFRHVASGITATAHTYFRVSARRRSATGVVVAVAEKSRRRGGASVPSSWAGDRGSRDCSGMSISTRQSLGDAQPNSESRARARFDGPGR